MPKENVLKMLFKDGAWIAVRPSGTEPKIIFYYSIKDNNELSATEKFGKYQNKINTIIES